MQNLGKIAFFLFFLPNALFGAVEAKVDTQTPEEGDVVTLVLSISGEKVQKPVIHSLCGTEVLSSASHSSITINNGVYKNAYTLTYQFAPTKSCEIEPIEVEVDGQKEQTQPIKIEVKPIVYTKNSDFLLELVSEKKEVYVGESFDVTLFFKQKLDTSPLDSTFEPPVFKGFWVKNESQPQRTQENGYAITKVLYTLAAQRPGENRVEGAKMKIATRVHKRDMFGGWIQNIKWKTYVSNNLILHAKELPSNLTLIGDFTLEVDCDKTSLNANEALSITVRIEGEGNFEDIKPFKPFIEGVSVFEEKPLIAKGKWSQKITFVADGDFVIPPFALEYFESASKTAKKLQTQPISITVKNTQTPKELRVVKQTQSSFEETEEGTKGAFSWIALLGVFIAGGCIGYLFAKRDRLHFFKNESKGSIKEPKTLLMKLLPYKEDSEVGEMIAKLEKNIYEKQNLEIEKKLLKEILKRYNLS